MSKILTNNSLHKHTAKTGYIFTLLAGALLVLLGLPAQGIAGEQMQIASLESAYNSHVMLNTSEIYRDTLQEEEEVGYGDLDQDED